MAKQIYFYILMLFICALQVNASDAITVDSLFKKKDEFRLVTNVDIINSNGTRRFSSYPTLLSYDDGSRITESKKIILGQTLMYGYNKKLDLFLSYNLAYDDLSYIESNTIKNKTNTDFDSLWLGANYNFDKLLGNFKQSISLQTSLTQKTKYQTADKNFSLKSYSLKYSLKNFSDPLISSIYFGTTQNLKRNINNLDVQLPNAYMVGLDLFLILNPNISLNMNFEQSYQTSMKEEIGRAHV